MPYNSAMFDLTTLPLPDFGLRCRHCGAPLAGLNEHRCGGCGRRFNLLTLLAQHRPILDIGLTCPTCEYSLTGLTGDRCPECGNHFRLAELMDEASEAEQDATLRASAADPPDHHVARRKPEFTGHERPLPDFGLTCPSCGMELAGAAGEECPSCGERFDLDSLAGGDEWGNVSRLVARDVVTTARALLYESQVPYVTQTSALQGIYGVGPASSLFVPREFLFDALHVLGADRPEEDAGRKEPDWLCPSCNEANPGDFDVCWHCQTPRPEGGHM
jgi:hypothetical protein